MRRGEAALDQADFECMLNGEIASIVLFFLCLGEATPNEGRHGCGIAAETGAKRSRFTLPNEPERERESLIGKVVTKIGACAPISSAGAFGEFREAPF